MNLKRNFLFVFESYSAVTNIFDFVYKILGHEFLKVICKIIQGRKLVAIIDPHIKKDDNYFLYKESASNGYFIKNADGQTDYDGHCWPGASRWLDYLNPDVRSYFAEKYSIEGFNNTYTWNDMNEPSVFSGPEVTMHKDAKHFGGWEHRDVHNIYGSLMVIRIFHH